ncbi:LuxR C-terminal-related transcriptional regulator [Dyadobacter sp. CY107]|uniref:LuxR C-terminal-related transcriptional regulator n=1 Tax=Dyadobacter fanqingshengii TaxID=2906443 RepID=UPI001F26EB74|nr:LuxR C-terminal-related transcriptional regulator [Dyadobacter fanqingshengii]MCF2502091.1 LuxR C-terminal-related transcriptional regulator [Dyadobacter fanqingshengii]
MKTFFDGSVEDSNEVNSLTLNPKSSVSNEIIKYLETLFPGRVILWCSKEAGFWLYSENTAQFYGLTPEELGRKTYLDYRNMIHPDDLEGYDLCNRKIRQILESDINPEHWGQYRFVIHYRVWRKSEYFQLREERIIPPPGQKPGGHHSLMSDATEDYPFVCVQLEWYRVGPLGYTKINNYTPKNQESTLSGRESEIIKLLAEGFNSKQIADQLFISVNTVRNHRANLLRKTNSRNLIQVLKTASQ